MQNFKDVSRTKGEGKSFEGHTYSCDNFLWENLPSLRRYFLSLPLATLGKEAKGNLPNGTEAAKKLNWQRF